MGKSNCLRCSMPPSRCANRFGGMPPSAVLLGDGLPAALLHGPRIAVDKSLRVRQIGLDLSIADSLCAQLPMRDRRGKTVLMPGLHLVQGQLGHSDEQLFEGFVYRLVNAGHLKTPSSATDVCEERPVICFSPRPLSITGQREKFNGPHQLTYDVPEYEPIGEEGVRESNAVFVPGGRRP